MNSNVEYINGKLIVGKDEINIKEMETKINYSMDWRGGFALVALLVGIFGGLLWSQINAFRAEMVSFKTEIRMDISKINDKLDSHLESSERKFESSERKFEAFERKFEAHEQRLDELYKILINNSSK